MSAIPLADRTIAVAVPDKLSLVLMQVTAKTPVTEEKFSELASALMGQSGSRLVNVTSDPTLARIMSLLAVDISSACRTGLPVSPMSTSG